MNGDSGNAVESDGSELRKRIVTVSTVDTGDEEDDADDEESIMQPGSKLSVTI